MPAERLTFGFAWKGVDDEGGRAREPRGTPGCDEKGTRGPRLPGELSVQPEDSRVHVRRRGEIPDWQRWIEGLVIGQRHVVVQQVVDVQPHRQPLRAKGNDLLRREIP